MSRTQSRGARAGGDRGRAGRSRSARLRGRAGSRRAPPASREAAARTSSRLQRRAPRVATGVCTSCSAGGGRHRISAARPALESRSLCLPARPTSTCPTSSLAEFGGNASYVAELLTRYRANPAAVDDEWRRYFRERFGEPEPPAAAPAPAAARRRARPRRSARPSRASACRSAGRRAADRREHGGEPRRPDGDDAAPGARSSSPTRTGASINEHRAANEQSKVSFTHLVSWAVIQALKALPGHERRLRRLERRAGARAPRGDPVRPRRGRGRRRTARGRSSCPTSRARRR